ncbi:MAG TPA: site-specific DNA-methyltransferase [Acidobacteriaceae bacterium]
MSYLIRCGHVLEELAVLADESVQCVVTSPPYWGLRDYGVAGQIGLEANPQEYIAKMVRIFGEVRRVLRADGTCWVNMGDSYCNTDKWGGGKSGNTGKHSIAEDGSVPSWTVRSKKDPIPGIKPKDLLGMPWRLAFALQEDGWYLRQDIIWAKPNPMPESVSDRCTKAHEYIFLLSKSEDYFFDAEAIKEKCSTNTHARGGGVNPKAKKEGQHSRMRVDRDPRHTTPRKDRTAHAGMSIQSGLARVKNHHPPRAKQNESFAAAVTNIVTHRNKRSVWTMATQPFREAHFATFPIALPSHCIKAGTSAKGACAVCGAPLSRIVEAYDTGARQKLADGWDTEPGSHGTIHRRQGRTDGEGDQPVIAYRTIGWRDCCTLFGAGAIPSVVLDPFSGSATTGVAALRLGRSYIGIELNPEYAAMARRRIEEDRPLFNRSEPREAPDTTTTTTSSIQGELL